MTARAYIDTGEIYSMLIFLFFLLFYFPYFLIPYFYYSYIILLMWSEDFSGALATLKRKSRGMVVWRWASASETSCSGGFEGLSRDFLTFLFSLVA